VRYTSWVGLPSTVTSSATKPRGIFGSISEAHKQTMKAVNEQADTRSTRGGKERTPQTLAVKELK